MKTTLTIQDSTPIVILAEYFVGVVNNALFDQHMLMLGESVSYPEQSKGDIQRMRATLRSIADKDERDTFVGMVRYLFKKQRTERGSDIRGRDYVARVLKARAESAAATAARSAA